MNQRKLKITAQVSLYFHFFNLASQTRLAGSLGLEKKHICLLVLSEIIIMVAKAIQVALCTTSKRIVWLYNFSYVNSSAFLEMVVRGERFVQRDNIHHIFQMEFPV